MCCTGGILAHVDRFPTSSTPTEVYVEHALDLLMAHQEASPAQSWVDCEASSRHRRLVPGPVTAPGLEFWMDSAGEEVHSQCTSIGWESELRVPDTGPAFDDATNEQVAFARSRTVPHVN